MIRVGFTFAFRDRGWIGGVNYYANLMHALALLPNSRIEPVILTSPDTPSDFLAALPPFEVQRTALVDTARRLRYLRKIPQRLLDRDPLMEAWLSRRSVALLSHSDPLGARAAIPTIGWIPDFQHRRMPEFFQASELALRDRGYGRYCTACKGIVLSSEDAQKDLAAFAPLAVAKSHVLHFVAGLGGADRSRVTEADLRARHGIVGPYFHLPNQFWAHKNHKVVVEALAILKERGAAPQVILTGHTADGRQPGYFDELMRHVEARRVGDVFRVLGLVAYADLAALMRHAVAIVNPSLFEGWSTTVEESKSLGKTIVLSDIPVHREQAPDHGLYFAPRDPVALADAMTRVMSTYSPDADLTRRVAAEAALPARFRGFGERYEAIVLKTIGASMQ